MYYFLNYDVESNQANYPLFYEQNWVKFMFSKKATKIDKIFTINLTLCSKPQINGEDFVNFCGLP